MMKPSTSFREASDLDDPKDGPSDDVSLALRLQRIPVLNKVMEHTRQIPPRWRVLIILLWIAWKFVAAFLVVYFLGGSFHGWTLSPPLSAASALLTNATTASPKVLYIVTSLAEFDSGHRATTKGKDRLGTLLLPVLMDSVESMRASNFDVDVYLILAYQLEPEREQVIRDRLPLGVGLEIWDNACPLGYDKDKDKDLQRIFNNTRALARQHRYVLKDKFRYYDLFVVFEDDMRITGAHVQQYLHVSDELDRLLELAPEHVEGVPEPTDPKKQTYFGPMTRHQLERLLPGFVRVEVLLNATETNGAQTQLDPIPLDYTVDNEERHFDPQPCCHVQMEPTETPLHPTTEDVVIWETNIRALSVRQLPPGSDLDWVALLPGPGKRLSNDLFIGGYWSGREGAFGNDNKKPSPGEPKLIAQQGGWMATKQQLWRLHASGLCQGDTFLPPLDDPTFHADGQESMNVEFYSGSYQLFTGVRGGCNMQRVVSLRPDEVSKHFLYHVANNKQRQLSRERMVRADHLWGQLNSVKKQAQASVQSKPKASS